MRCLGLSSIFSSLPIVLTFTWLASVKAFAVPITHNQLCKARRKNATRLFSAKLEVFGVTLKLAVDSQWSVADRAATISERFTSEESLDLVHRLRRFSGAVLVGKGTVQEDDPSLTVRRVFSDVQPTRIILDSSLSLDAQKYKLFKDGLSTIIYHAESVPDEERSPYASSKVICEKVPLSSNGRLDLTAVMENIKLQHGIKHLMVEGGPSVAVEFLEQGLVDRVILIQAQHVKFRYPYPSNLSTKKLSAYGLKLLGEFESGGDVVQCWSRPDTLWPTQDLRHWP